MKEAEERRAQEASVQKVGFHLGKLALQTIREHDSYRSFERRVALLKDFGVNVGSKSHGQDFVPKIRSAMHAVVIAGFREALTTVDPATKRPRAIALMADKATVRRRTGQMHGLLLMLEGRLTALFISTLVAPDSTGLGLAKLLIDTISGRHAHAPHAVPHHPTNYRVHK